MNRSEIAAAIFSELQSIDFSYYGEAKQIYLYDFGACVRTATGLRFLIPGATITDYGKPGFEVDRIPRLDERIKNGTMLCQGLSDPADVK